MSLGYVAKAARLHMPATQGSGGKMQRIVGENHHANQGHILEKRCSMTALSRDDVENMFGALCDFSLMTTFSGCVGHLAPLKVPSAFLDLAQDMEVSGS